MPTLSASEWIFEEPAPDFVGPRGLALGNAYTAVAEGATAGFWNPAGLIQSQGVAVVGQMKLNERRTWAFDPKGIRFCYDRWAFSWGNKIALRLPERTPDYSYYSLASQLAPQLSIGFAASFVRRHPWPTYQWFGIDPRFHLGVLTYVQESTRLGIATHGTESVDLGVSHRWHFGLVAFRLRLPWNNLRDASPHLGWEQHLGHGLYGRLGLSSDAPTAGLGWQWRPLHIDYAWTYQQQQSIHLLALELSR